MQSSFQSYGISEESYCSPWDLKSQEEKFKLLNEQRQISSLSDALLHPSNTNNQSTSLSLNHSNTNKVFHRTYSVRASSSSPKKFITLRELSPPVLPPLPPGGLIPSCQCNTNSTPRTDSLIIENLDPSLKKISNCFNPHTIRSSTDKSRSFLFTSTSPSNKSAHGIDTENTQSYFKRLSSSIENNSLLKTQTAYEQPWDTFKTSFINNRHGGSLRKISNTEKQKQCCSSSTFSIISPCQHSEDMTMTTIPIDHYLWYHYTMSRRQAEDILQSHLPGSFLVRQSESGNQNDYSLSIKTPTSCVHMRICYLKGFYILGECSRPFLSVSSMIKYFSQTSVPIRGAAHIKLGTPVLRWEISSSSLSNDELL